LRADWFPAMPVFMLAGAEEQQHGPETSWQSKKKGSAHQQLPGLRRPPGLVCHPPFRGWCTGGRGIDPSKEAPGFHAHLMIPRKSESPPQKPAPERPEQLVSMGPMMDNFDSFLEHYDPTDEQISLGVQLLLGSADDLDATMEQLLMSMLGSLETYATAVEAGINY
jgi:hypothetical protein